MHRLSEIPFPYLFHVTFTPYHQDIESHVLDKKAILEGIVELSKQIGKDRVYVRYDPILLNDVIPSATMHKPLKNFVQSYKAK